MHSGQMSTITWLVSELRTPRLLSRQYTLCVWLT